MKLTKTRERGLVETIRYQLSLGKSLKRIKVSMVNDELTAADFDRVVSEYQIMAYKWKT